MKILFLNKYLNPSGVTTFMYNLGKELLERGIQVGIATGRERGEHPYGVNAFGKIGFDVFEVPFTGIDFDLKRMITSLSKVLHLVKEYSPDLIHVHWRACSFYAEVAFHLYRIPYIVTLHLDKIPYTLPYRLLSFWGEYAIAISSETYNCLKNDFKIPTDRIKLIYNGVDDKYFRPPTDDERRKARDKFGFELNSFVISLIGRLGEVKGHDILLNALKILKYKYNIEPYVIFAGTGSKEYEEKLLNIINNLQIDAKKILFTGFIDSREALWASDVLVLPSRKEGFALVVVEAMLCGVVSIRTPAAGAYDQIKDGVNGFIIPFEDHKTLAEKIYILYNNEMIRKKMSEEAIKTAKNKFTLDKMVNEYINIYEEVILKHKYK